MDDFEKIITSIVSKKINTPMEYQEAIKTAFNQKKDKFKFGFIKTFATTCAGIIVTTGIVYAGYTTYEKIWKEPREYNIEKEKPAIISEEEKKEVISEETINKKARTILDKLGYPDKKIKKIELQRSYADNVNSYYDVRTEEEYYNEIKNIGISIHFNAETGDFQYFFNNDFEYNESKLENISIDTAKQMAKTLLEDLNFPSNTYEIKMCEEIKTNKWRIDFSRSYNGIYNRYDEFMIVFGVINNEIIVEGINGLVDNSFENNPFVITEEEAINIAKAKEEMFSNESIINITAKKSIEKMNAYVYRLEKNIEDINSIKTEDKIRNVWVIKIEHERDPKNPDETLSEIEYYKKYDSKKYFIDATTGEIIGGEQARFNFGIE